MHAGLNAAQAEAVLATEGPLLILAGAGAGKTRVIVHRIAEIIKNGEAPERILAVTFTNKAANEMKERVRALLKEHRHLSPYDTPHTQPFIGTFHALSLHIIKSFHGRAGLPKTFSIFDRSDSLRAVKKAIEARGFDPKQLEPRRVLSVMGRAKGDALSPHEFRDARASSFVEEAVADVWETYGDMLKKEKALDFDDILVTAYALLRDHADIRAYFQNAWTHIHIDEYQDTNRVQYEIIRILAEKHGNLCVVGDADQNIYSWRGASLEHILNFERDFPGSRVVVLAENYRSTKTIIRAANDAIAKNTRRVEKTLFTNGPDGDPIALYGAETETHEAAFVARECARLIRGRVAPESIAILYRANFQSRALEEAFLSAGIPYQVLGTRFFDRKEIKDALAFLRLAGNRESATDLARALSAVPCGIGKVTVAKLVAGEPVPPSAAGKTHDFFRRIDRIAEAVKRERASEAVRHTLRTSGLLDLYEKGKGEDEERLQNLKELVTVAARYDALSPGEGIEKLLEEAALQSDQDELDLAREKKPGVKLMTVHASKGLEFPYIFITGLEEGLFPQERDGEDEDSEEERRLFYVALTRAQTNVYLLYAGVRSIFGTRVINTPSIFLSEMDPALMRIIATPYGSAYDEPDATIS